MSRFSRGLVVGAGESLVRGARACFDSNRLIGALLGVMDKENKMRIALIRRLSFIPLLLCQPHPLLTFYLP